MKSMKSSIRGGDTSNHREETTQQAEEGTVKAPVQTGSYLASVLVPRAASTRDITALETAMQGLALDDRHPVALELAATASSRHFLLRATSAMSQRHLADQVQARYPQAIIRQLAQEDDPLALREGEIVSVVELRAGAAAYLPLRALRERELLQEGADPLLGILGVFNHLPPHMRVVTQLALIPAPPAWSQPYRRKSVEHPLEQEHLRATAGVKRRAGEAAPVHSNWSAWACWSRCSSCGGASSGSSTRSSPPGWCKQASRCCMARCHSSPPLIWPRWLIGGIGGPGRTLLPRVRRLADQEPPRDDLPSTICAWWMKRRRARPIACACASSCFLPRRGHHRRVMPIARRGSCNASPSNRSPGRRLMDVYRDWRETASQHKQCRQEQEEVLDHLVAAYRQYHTASGGYFVPRCVSQRKAGRLLVKRKGWLRSRMSGWEYDLARSSHLLSVADIAALWHLPQAQDLADLPYVERTRARTALAPTELTLGQGWKIGTSSHVGHTVPVYLPTECLGHNLLTVASTGKGKSTLFQHLAQAVCAVRAGRGGASAPGLAFIEPHGDVVHALCGLVPASERDNVVLVDLAHTDYPVGINPLDMVGKDRDKAVDTLITLSEHLWVASYGSRTENVLEYALKTLADANEWLIQSDPYQGPDKQYTLLDVVPLLRLASFRHAVLEQVRDSLLLDWWQHYYEPMDAHQQREITSSVITKLSKFASSRVARRILGQPRSTIDLREVIRSGKLLLVSTASGVVGADLSELIGIVLLGLFRGGAR